MRYFLAASLLALTACESSTTASTVACMTPAATYKIEWKADTGNCPAETLKALIEGAADTSAKVSEACFTKSMSSSSNFTDAASGVTCAVAVSGSAFGTNASYGGTASVAITCSDNSSCQHGFKLIYTKQ